MQRFRFLLFADLHCDTVPDAGARLDRIVDAALAARVDCIVQCGDFCRVSRANEKYIQRLAALPIPVYHALGNHDMEGSTKAGVLAFLGMRAPWQAFEHSGVTGIVLDTACLDDADQLHWLDDMVERARGHIAVFGHTLDLMRDTPRSAWLLAWIQGWSRRGRRIAYVAGAHYHVDAVMRLNDTVYHSINSASYYWLGEGYQVGDYPEEVLASHHNLRHVTLYRDPLYAVVEIGDDGSVRIDGVQSAWMHSTPMACGHLGGKFGFTASARVSSAWFMR